MMLTEVKIKCECESTKFPWGCNSFVKKKLINENKQLKNGKVNWLSIFEPIELFIVDS